MQFMHLQAQTKTSWSAFSRPRARFLNLAPIHIGTMVLAAAVVGLAVIVSTYYVDNVKLLVGLIGGVAFVLLTMRWPEFGILSMTALMSGLISLSWLPALRLGPISIQISDVILLLLLGLVFLRAATRPGFVLFGSPVTLPLLLFVGAYLLSAVNAIVIYGVNANLVLRTVRVLSLWLMFFPTLQLIRDERSLRRFATGLLILSVVLLIGVIFPNRFEPLLPIEQRAAGTGTVTYSGFTRLYFTGDMVLYGMFTVTMASLATISRGKPYGRIVLLGFLFFWAFRTMFRSYWLTLFGACILLVGALTGKERVEFLRRLLPVSIVGILCLVALLAIQPTRVEQSAFVVIDRLGSLLQDPLKQEASLQWRAFENRYAMLQIARHPLLGLGLANSYRPPMLSESSSIYSGWAHRYLENGYLYLTVMTGMVGLLPFLWMCAAHFIRVARNLHRIRDENFRAIYLGLGVAFIGLLVCNVVTPVFVFGTRLVFFPVTMGISEVILRLETGKQAATETPLHA